MCSISEIRESPNFQQLKNSIEFKSELRTTVFIGCFLGILSVPILFNQQNSGIKVLYILMSTGLIAYQLYRLFRIFSHMDNYTYTEAVLDRPHLGNRGTRYFTVRIRDCLGREFDVNTNTVFNKNEPCFEDYLDQKVLIGYNNVTGLVVVIKKLSSCAKPKDPYSLW